MRSIPGIVAALFLGIYTPAQYPGGWGVYGPYGRPPEGAYDLPPCNPYYNRDCGRFREEGPRSRAMRCAEHPMMPDCPRYGGRDPWEGPGTPPFYDPY